VRSVQQALVRNAQVRPRKAHPTDRWRTGFRLWAPENVAPPSSPVPLPLSPRAFSLSSLPSALSFYTIPRPSPPQPPPSLSIFPRPYLALHLPPPRNRSSALCSPSRPPPRAETSSMTDPTTPPPDCTHLFRTPRRPGFSQSPYSRELIKVPSPRQTAVFAGTGGQCAASEMVQMVQMVRAQFLRKTLQPGSAGGAACV